MAKQKEFECSFGPSKGKCVAPETIGNIDKIPQTFSDSYSSQNVGYSEKFSNHSINVTENTVQRKDSTENTCSNDAATAGEETDISQRPDLDQHLMESRKQQEFEYLSSMVHIGESKPERSGTRFR